MRQVKSIALIPLLLMLIAPVVMAGDFKGEARFSTADFQLTQKAGFDVIEMKDAEYLTVTGSPIVPIRVVNVALPAGAVVTGINLIDVEFVMQEGPYEIMPAARPRQISNPAQTNIIIKDRDVYETDAFYPGRWVQKADENELAGQRYVALSVFPVQYNPVSGAMCQATSVKYEITYTIDPNYVPKTFNFSDRVRDHFAQRLQTMVANASDVSIPMWTGHASRSLTPGDFEYVIITKDSWVSAWDDLVDHWTKVGLPCTVVTTDWIYSNYSGGDNQDKIKAFVEDAHKNWGTLYVLLGSDVSNIPYRTLSYSYGSVISDNWYGDIDPIWSMDVYIGRAPVDNTTQIGNFISKTLDYINNPPANFGNEVFFMGFDLDNQTEGEDLMISVKNQYLPAYADFSSEYDSESGSHKTDCTNYMNAGQANVGHCDHCNTTVIGVGSHRHGSHWYNSDAQNFSNGDRVGCFYTLGCYPGNYGSSDCWGEELVENTGGGAAVFIGNSRYGWYVSGFASAHSGGFLTKFFKHLWTKPWFRASEVEGISKSTGFVKVTINRYIYRELNVHGDPALPLWTDVPGTLSCTYDASIDRGYHDYTVNVKSGGADLEGALVCVMMDDEIYARALTDASGTAVMSIKPLVTGTMNVTVTAKNHLMHTGTCAVNGPLPDMLIDLELDALHYYSGTTVYYDLTLTNNTGSSQTQHVWTNITAPGNQMYPPSGYLNGPYNLTVGPFDTKSGSLSFDLPWQAPFGTYYFNAFVGPDPATIDIDREVFEIVSYL